MDSRACASLMIREIRQGWMSGSRRTALLWPPDADAPSCRTTRSHDAANPPRKSPVACVSFEFMAGCRRWPFGIRVAYALCLTVGASTHVLTLLRRGWGWNYGGMPPVSVVFWTSLTFLDPLAVVLLFLRPRPGVSLTLAIMVTDAADNAWIIATYGGAAWAVAAQAPFLAFVLATMRLAWGTAIRKG
jgi:hypothetical protein